MRPLPRPPDPVTATRELVAIPSVNPVLEEGGTGERAVAEDCLRRLLDQGWDARLVEVAPGRFNVSAERGADGPSLLLNGHLDTVGVAGMTVAPFGGDSTADRIVGRGACDMKSGVAVVLEVARVAAAEDWPGRLHVLLVADEEHASVGMQAAIADGAAADFAVVTEPTSLAVMPAHKGFAWVRGIFHGTAAHGSRPEVGVDAVRAAARFVAALDRLDDELRTRVPHPLLGYGSWHVGTIRGGAAPSIYPERCEVVFERRTIPGEAETDFVEELRRHADRLRTELADGPHGTSELRVDFTEELLRPSSDVGPAHPGVRALLDAIAAEGAAPGDAADRDEATRRPTIEPRIEGMTAWVDAALLVAAGTPAVCFGPGSIAKAHAADEYVDVHEIETAARVLTRFARDFLHR